MADLAVPPRVLAGAAAYLALLAAAPREARAQTTGGAPVCQVQTAPAALSAAPPRVPANAPAFAIVGRTYNGASLDIQGAFLDGPPPAPSEPLVLVDDPRADGKLATSPGTLVPGTTYTLRPRARCTSGAQPLTAPTSDATFIAGERVTLPLSIGRVSHEPLTERDGPEAPLVAPVTITLSEELRAYHPLTRFTLLANGAPWISRDYGTSIGLANDGSRLVFELRRDGLRGASECRPSVCNGSTSSATRVTFELRAHVAGTEVDPAPITFEAPIDCAKTVACGEGNDVGASCSASPRRSRRREPHAIAPHALPHPHPARKRMRPRRPSAHSPTGCQTVFVSRKRSIQPRP